MSRPASVTASAVTAIACSILTALFGAGILYFVLSPTFQSVRARQPDPATVRGLVIAATIFIEACAAWGIATAVGLLRLRSWARISIVVFAGILAFGALIALIASLAAPPPATPGVPAKAAAAFRITMAVVYAIPIGIAAWWLVLFTSRSTTEAFASADPASGASSRPLSMSVIGYLLILGGVGSLYPIIAGAPGFFVGGVFTGWSARLVYTLLGVAEVFAGTQLLGLRERGRVVAIGVCCVTLVNALAMIFSPASAERFIALQRSRFETMAPNTPAIPHSVLVSGAWLGLVALVPLWFLVRRKEAFRAAS